MQYVLKAYKTTVSSGLIQSIQKRLNKMVFQ